MKLENQNVLLFTRTMQLGGTENVVLQLCEILKPLVNKVVVCSCGGVNVEGINNMGIIHYEIPDIEKKTPEVILRTISLLNKIVSKESITMIHTHHRMAAFYIYIMGLYNKCIFFNTSHNTFQDKVFLTKIAFRKANLIACGSMVKKNLVDHYGLPATSIRVVHNAVKPFHEDVKPLPLITELHQKNCFIIGNIGRLSEQKGIEYFIKSIPLISESYPEARFLIIGSGKDEEKLKLLTKNLSVENITYFTGYRSDIQNIMSQLDLIVLSSLWEGLPLTPIEAFSVGKTVVATAVDGTVEIVEDGKSGYLIEPKNPNDLAEKVKKMIGFPEIRSQMEMNAKERYESDFSFEKFSDAYIECYLKECKE